MRTARVAALLILCALTLALAASPSSAATLCSTKTNPCTGTEYKVGTKFEATLTAGTKATFTTPFITVTCTGATVSGETTGIGGKEKAVEAKVSNLTFSGCIGAGSACTLTALHLPYSAAFTALEGIEALTLEHAEGVGVTAKCPLITCNYTAKSVELSLSGGSPAFLNASSLPFEGCLGKASFTAKYEATTPKPLFVTSSAPAERSFAAEEGYGPGNLGEPTVLRTWAGPGLNAATGNLVETQVDLALVGRGPRLHMTRTYNSRLAASQEKPGAFGYGWTGSYGAYLTIDEKAATATVHQDDGSAVVFYLVEGKYLPAKWVQARLIKNGTSYVYTLPSQLTLEFNASGQLAKEADRHGNALTLAYNAKSQLETVTEGAGRKITLAYNAEGQVESAKDPMGHLAKYTYESGKLATVTLPGGKAARWKFAYNASHELTSKTDGRGNVTTNEYDGSHRIEWQKKPLERKRTLKYTEGKTTATEPNSSTTVFLFNAVGEPTSVALASGTGIEATTTSEYDTAYRLLTLTDPNKHATKYTYDAAGNRTSEKDANSNEYKWTYNSTHDVLTATTPRNETTTYIRNASGDPETIERPAPGATIQKETFKYAKNGDLESATDPLTRTTTFEYDAYGDRKAETDPEGDKRTWGFNEDSQLTSEVSPRGNEAGAEPSKFETKFERDEVGRPLTVTNPLGHTTKYTYDGNGNVETVTDSKLHTTTYTYNANDERTKVKRPTGITTETDYDSMGRVKSRTDGNTHTTKYERNLLEQLTEEIDPLERKTSFKYDTAGNLKELTDPAKRVTTLTYDAGDRLTKASYSEEVTPAVTLEYDKDGNLTVMKDGTGTTTRTFDQLGRLTEVENGSKEVVKYEYNLGEEQTKITYPNTKSITQAFDKASRLEKVTDWLGGETKFAYNRDSELKAITFPTESGDKDEYEYTNAGSIAKATMAKGAETLASLTYTLDKDEDLELATQKGLPGEEKVEYGYDENERLSKGGKTAYKYDGANSPTTIGEGTYSYDKASQLEKGAGTTYAFNSSGQRTKATPSAGPATTYGYDQAGNLISVKRPEEGKTPKIEDSFKYDGAGQRISQTTSGSTTHMAWNTSEGQPLLLADGTNSYLYGPDGLPYAQIGAAGKPTYLHQDEEGSTRLLTGATGKVEGSYTYSPYGVTLEHTGTASTPLGYKSQYTSSDTGLVLSGQEYDPATAQFLTPGPSSGVESPYSFGAGNPAGGQPAAGGGFRGGVGSPQVGPPRVGHPNQWRVPSPPEDIHWEPVDPRIPILQDPILIPQADNSVWSWMIDSFVRGPGGSMANWDGLIMNSVNPPSGFRTYADIFGPAVTPPDVRVLPRYNFPTGAEPQPQPWVDFLGRFQFYRHDNYFRHTPGQGILRQADFGIGYWIWGPPPPPPSTPPPFFPFGP